MNALLIIPSLLLAGATAHAAPVQGAGEKPADKNSYTVFAEVLYSAAGDPIENALVVVEGGKITAITPGASAPSGDDALRAAALTPGLIDASIHIATGLASVEEAKEVGPQYRVTESIDWFDPAWALQAKSGVTTAMVAPMDRNVIGGLTAVVKTAGPEMLDARLVRADVALRGAIGGEPSLGNSPVNRAPRDFFQRRPTTRMGVEWVWRKALYDAAAAPRQPERDFPGSDVLRRALAGELPLNIQAWTTQDIRTAVFLKEEMAAEGLGDLQLIIDAAAEAWKEPQLLVRSGAKVVLPPHPAGGRSGFDNAFMSWNVARTLLDVGIPVALSSHGSRSDAGRLGMQAGYAMRGGLTFDEALAAVTKTPAEILGVADRVGTIEVGKDADLVLWSGRPFEPSSRVTGVLIDGRIVLDPNTD